MKLQGKTVLVTGGTKGIGKACALAFAEQGANVVVNYAHDEKVAQQVLAEIQGKGVKALVTKADISDQTQVDTMIIEVEKQFGSIDVLVNNASVIFAGDGSDRPDVTQKYFDIDFMGYVRTTLAVRRIMKKGKIIFVSSIHGKLGHGRPNVISYSAMKAALESYMKNLAKDVAPDILVNAVSPGRTLTPQWGEMTEERKKEQAAGMLINRWIEPSEIADGVLFLAKNDAVCGEVLVVDGGMSLKVLG